MRFADRLFPFAVSALLFAGPAVGATSATVSPGELDREVESASGCPTFSWAAVEGATGYELAVFERDEAGELERVLRREVAATATSWSPDRAECLEGGRAFAWTVRARFASAGAAIGDWSPPRRFRVPAGPSDEDVAAALDVLRRWRGGRGDRGESGSSPRPRVDLGGGGAAVPTGGSRGGGAAAAVRGTFGGAAGVGVSGLATATTGPVTGVRGETASSQGYGILGISTATNNSPFAVRGEITATNGAGVSGYAGHTAGGAYGVRGDAFGTSGAGVAGFSHDETSPYAYGVQGTSDGPNGVGVHGGSFADSGLGVWGTSGSTATGFGVAASVGGTSAIGIDSYTYAASGSTTGIRSWVESPSGRGVHAFMDATTGAPMGVLAVVSAPSGVALHGDSNSTSGTTYGVRGEVSSTQGRGVYGSAPNTTGAYAGYFQGRVHVTGTLSKGGGSFRIDHPLAPEEKYLSHSFVESPDMMNVYNGNVRLDERGEAWVELPEWFEALNRDFRYQLTPIGEASMVWIGRGVEANRFLVRGAPRVEVSWQVTGVRRDPWAVANRIPVEEEKPEAERGTYLHPREWGVAEERGLDWRLDEPLRRAQEDAAAVDARERGRPTWAEAHPTAPGGREEAGRAPR